MCRTGTRHGVPSCRTPARREGSFGERPRCKEGPYRAISVTELLFDRQQVADVVNGAR
jgi:hypothetical protein